MRRYIVLAVAALAALSSAEGAYISVTGYIPNTPVAGFDRFGNASSHAYVDAYYNGDPTWPSTFNNNFLVMGDGTKQSDPITMSIIPYVQGIYGELYFMFTFDSQETQQGKTVELAQIRVLVDGTPIWTSTDSLVVNGGVNASGWDGTTTSNALETAKPLGNGADLSVLIPVWHLNGLNLTGASSLVFEATEALNSNGNDEWKLVTAAYPGTAFFCTTCPVYSPPPPAAVPEPSTFAAILGAALLWTGERRLRHALSGTRKRRRG